MAVYPGGEEDRCDFRRTGCRKSFPLVVNNSGGAINATLFL
ncbi:MAG: hypothetical protein ACHQIM_03940 [Sphingobacteriales bacterium]